MIVTVIQTSPVLLSSEKNRVKIEKFLQKSPPGIIVLPELATSGYQIKSKSELKKVAEDGKTGPSVVWLKYWAKKKKSLIIMGFPEKHMNNYYNSAMAVSSSNTWIYRKIHLFRDEKKIFKSGKQKPFLIRWKNIKVGIMICFDWIFPELMRSLSIKGADLIVHPSNLVLPWAPRAMVIRSLENHVYSVTSNRIGTERGLTFIGQSQGIDPKGKILARLPKTKTGLISFRIDTKQSRNKWVTPKNHLFQDRKPSLYS